MDFGARTAGASFAHHPEVVLLAAVDDVDFWIQTDRPKLRCPQFPGFLIAISRILLGHIGLINRGIDALGRKLPNLDYQLPGPIDGVLLEVVAEGPIPQHLEKGVVIGVQADVIQIVVFATGPDALLGVCGPSIKCRNRTGPLGDIGFSFAQENWNELIHASIGEQQVGAVRQ